MFETMVNRLRESVGEAFMDGKVTVTVNTNDLCALILSVQNGAAPVEAKKRGRKPGVTVAAKPAAEDAAATVAASTGRRGRPKGSKNKPKEDGDAPAADTAELTSEGEQKLDDSVVAEIEKATAGTIA